MAEKRTWSVYKPVYPWAGLWGTAAASRRAKDGVQQPVQAAFLTLDKDGATAGAKAAAEDTKQITHVHVTCKPGTEDEFIEACLANAASSVLEPDNLRFDVLRHRDEPNKFMLVEVYATSEGPVAHRRGNCAKEAGDPALAVTTRGASGLFRARPLRSGGR